MHMHIVLKLNVYVLRNSVELLQPKSTHLLYVNFTEIQNWSEGYSRCSTV